MEDSMLTELLKIRESLAQITEKMFDLQGEIIKIKFGLDKYLDEKHYRYLSGIGS